MHKRRPRDSWRVPWAWERPPRIIGHRGAPYEAPENTLASFEACLRAGVGAAELDARVSADGEVLVHHDAELGRIIRGVGAVGSLAADELARLGVPRLADVLALPLALDVEMKADADNARELPRRVLDLVKAAGAQERVLVTSFDHELADEYARLSGSPAGMILFYAPEPDELASFPRLAYVALAQEAAIPEALEVLREAERRALVWTVNDPRAAAALPEDVGIVTDRPAQLARFRAEAGPAP